MRRICIYSRNLAFSQDRVFSSHSYAISSHFLNFYSHLNERTMNNCNTFFYVGNNKQRFLLLFLSFSKTRMKRLINRCDIVKIFQWANC